MTCKAVNLHITGMIQGVGFRPFVYNLAGRYGIAGWVSNDASGVDIAAEAAGDRLAGFIAAVQDQAPPLAVIEAVTVRPAAPQAAAPAARRSAG